MTKSHVKNAKKVVRLAEMRARKARNGNAPTPPRRAPSRVPLWLRLFLARFACSVLWCFSSVFSIAGLWWSRPGKECFFWEISTILSHTGLRCFDWATGIPRS